MSAASSSGVPRELGPALLPSTPSLLPSSSSSSALAVTLPSLCPRMHELGQLTFPARPLSSEDVPLATDVCRQLADKWSSIAAHADELIPALVVEVTPGVMDRVLLFKDEHVELRAHLFKLGMTETHLHNHGNSFISTCLQGGYVHKLWAVQSAEGQSHYSIERKPGGLLFAPVKQQGTVSNVLCQPFQARQSLFISSSAYHTVAVDPNQTMPVVTLVLRQTARVAPTHILSDTREIEAPTEKIQLASATERVDILRRLGAAMDYYLRGAGSSAPPPPLANFHFEISNKLDQVLTGVVHLTRAEAEARCRNMAVGITVYMLATIMAFARWTPETVPQFNELHWTLESLLDRSIRPQDIDGMRWGPDSLACRLSFKMLRIYSGSGARENGFQMAEDFILRISDSDVASFIHRELPDLEWRDDLRMQPIQDRTADSRSRALLLLDWACHYHPNTMKDYRALFTDAVERSMPVGQKLHAAPQA